MSATIKYRVIASKEHVLPTAIPSTRIDQLSVLFGSLPLKLDQSAIPTLKGAAAVDSDDFWNKLIKAIDEHRSIEIYADY